MSTVFGLIESPELRASPMHIVGVGGIGSNLAYELVKLGVENLHLHDFDVVNSYNWKNQRYRPEDAGVLKVRDLAASLRRDCNGFIATEHYARVGIGSHLTGIVFFCMDTMRARGEVFDACVRNNAEVKLLIDARLNAYTNRIVTLVPTDEMHLAMWDAVAWYPDQEVVFERAACGSKLALGAASSAAANEAAWQLIRYDMLLRGEATTLYNDITIDRTLRSPEPLKRELWE
jgi:hypothetical protein